MFKAKTNVSSISGMAILLSAMFTPLAVFAQSNTKGWIHGKITTDGTSGIAGATVTATSVASGASLSTRSSKSGSYRFNALEPGRYNLEVHSNTDKATFNGVSVSLGIGTTRNLILVSSIVALEEVRVTG